MKYGFIFLISLAAASVLMASKTQPEIDANFHTGYSSEYLFRGAILGQDLVETGVAASTEMSGLGLLAGAWYASFEKNRNGVRDVALNELNLFAEVSKDFAHVTTAFGYIYYDHPSALGDDAQEVFLSLEKTFYGVDHSLTYYEDIERDNAGYMEWNASKEFELRENLSLFTGSYVGYLAEEGDWGYFAARVALDWSFNEMATISPFVTQSWGFDSLRNESVAGAVLYLNF